MYHLRFRQVHLDFHTSGLIPGVGSRFNKRQFQEALKVGNVNSITIFSKCHHGWSYHPTKVGKMHPSLKFDLLARQIDACREINVRCPIYLSAGVDERIAMEHPEWVVKNRDGTTYDPLEVGWFKVLRFNSPYMDFLCAQIEEVVQRWPDNDGIFLDIIGTRRDYSQGALEDMQKLGLNPANLADVDAYGQRVLMDYYRRSTASVRSVRKDTPVFHNGGHIAIGSHKFINFNSHLELESLPTGGWGYDHFPLSARYVITTKFDFLGMTGKFHTTWGEFGGFKRAAALRHECNAMLAYGSKASIGDQLHPNGEMNLDTYRLIGEAYKEVEAKEPWCDYVKPVVKIAVVSAEKSQAGFTGQGTATYSDEGAARMLLELHLPFVVLDDEADWDGFDLIVLPDGYTLTAGSLARAKRFLKGGGKLLAADTALLNEDRTAFAIDPGAKLLGRSEFVTDYIVATGLTPDVNVRSPIVIHGGAYEVKPTRAKTLAGRRVPYFNRTWEHFCSHQHAPDAPGEASPSAVVTPQIAYFAHKLFSRYRMDGQPLLRDFALAAIRHLLRNELPVVTNLPTTGRFNVMEQRREKRYVAHVLYAPTAVRGKFKDQPIEIIEDLIPLRDTTVALRIPRKIKSARLVPSGDALGFSQDHDLVSFTIPEFTSHQMVELNY